jgi:hypothetical protein
VCRRGRHREWARSEYPSLHSQILRLRDGIATVWHRLVSGFENAIARRVSLAAGFLSGMGVMELWRPGLASQPDVIEQLLPPINELPHHCSGLVSGHCIRDTQLIRSQTSSDHVLPEHFQHFPRGPWLLPSGLIG